jgi:Na+-transporting methylmalonyl-CoA/oxaloacetate decarboxylase gamma subunit
MADALRITGLGMGLVFAAMALVLVAMVLLVRLRDAEPDTEAEPAAAEETSGIDERASQLRVAIIAAAIARARALDSDILKLPASSSTPSPWWAHHQTRQLNSLLRKRA